MKGIQNKKRMYDYCCQRIIQEYVEEVKKMTIEEIEEYINTSEPYDKAGGYAIQGLASKFIEGINGDYFNVVGLV